MKQSPAQQRVIERMLAGARLNWNCVAGRFELVGDGLLLGVQARTITALEAAGLVERECLGDVLLSPKARQTAATRERASEGEAA